jgi:hypothetical protein
VNVTEGDLDAVIAAPTLSMCDGWVATRASVFGLIVDGVQGSPAVRFWAKVDRPGLDPGVCWLWTGSLHPSGYGQFGLGRTTVRVHRWVYEWFYGEPIGEGMVIDHICMVRRCVNPWHLREVTRAVSNVENTNTFAGVNARKTHCPRGHEYNAVYMKDGRPSRVCNVCTYLLRKQRSLSPQ